MNFGFYVVKRKKWFIHSHFALAQKSKQYDKVLIYLRASILTDGGMFRREISNRHSQMKSNEIKSTWKLFGKLYENRWCHKIKINWFRFKKKLYFIQSLTTDDTNLNDFDFSISFTCMMCAQVCVFVNLCSTLDIFSPKESDHSMFFIYVNTTSLTDSQINRMPYACSFCSHQRPPQTLSLFVSPFLLLSLTLLYLSIYLLFPIIILTSS